MSNTNTDSISDPIDMEVDYPTQHLSVLTTECLINVESDTEDPPTVIHKKNRRRSHTLEEKIKILGFYKTIGRIKETGRIKRVDPPLLRDWIRQENKLRSELQNRKVSVRFRKRVSYNRKPLFKVVDEEVYKWFRERRDKGIAVTGEELREQALHEYKKLRKTSDGQIKLFSASKGWLTRFKHRCNLTVRVVTSVGQKIPSNAGNIANEFFDRVDRFRSEDPTGQSIILNMDELPLYLIIIE